MAFQEPLPTAFPLCTTVQVPDIELPDTEPLYVISCEPTVPKVIWSPCSEPLIGVSWLPKPEILIVPLRFEPDVVQITVKVPLKAPLY